MPTSKNDTIADSSRLRALVSELQLTGPLSIERLAHHLGTSTRTLQRRLTERKTTYRALVDQVRLESARILLCQTDLSVQDIAARLSYGAPSGFARAFGRWTGKSPLAYRASIGRPLPSRTNKKLARNG